MPLGLRWGTRTTAVVWLGWFVLCGALMWEPLRFHIDYFESPGPWFRPAILALLPPLIAVALLYPRLRTGWVRRAELPTLALAAALLVLVHEPVGGAVALLPFASAYALGGSCRGKAGRSSMPAIGEVALSTALGLGLFILLLTALGMAGLLRTWVFVLLAAAPLAARPRSILELWRTASSWPRIWADDRDLQSPLIGIGAVFGAIFLLMALMVALAPSVVYDSLAMHLPAVSHYLTTRRLEPLPNLAYSYYPQGYELLLTLAHGLGGQPAAQLASLAFAVLTLGIAYAIVRRLGASRGAACFGLFAAAIIPFLHWTGSVVKNDFALVFFQLCALYCWLRAREEPQARHFVLGAFLLGCAFAVKYVALFGTIPLGFLYLWELRRLQKPVRTALAMGAVFVCAFVFWNARAYVETGNPVYPSRSETATRALPAIGGGSYSRSTLWMTYPWIAHFEGPRVFESPTPNPYGFSLWLLAPAWLLVRRKTPSPDERACLFFIAVYYAYWVNVWGVGRYGLPMIFVFSGLTATRAWALYEQGGRAVRAGLQAGVAAAAVFGMLVTMILEVNFPQIRYMAGLLDKPGYLREALATYPSLEFLHGVMRPGDRVLSMVNCSRAYAPDPANFICFSVSRRTLETAPARFADRMERDRFDYLLVPSTPLGQSAIDLVQQTWPIEKLHTDPHWSAYRVAGPPADPSQ